MAVITIDRKFNFDASDWPWAPTVTTADTLTIGGGIHELSMSGEFAYPDSNSITGVVESATYSRNGNVVYTITDINRSADLLHGALQLVQMTGETDILLAYIFGGDDIMSGSAGSDFIMGYDGDDWVSGGGGADKVSGNVGNDIVLGGAGDDILRGGYGDDVLDGGSGNNIIFSGEGSDTIVISSPHHAGIDTIVLLESTDTIQLNAGPGAAFKNLGDGGALDNDLFQANAGGNAVDADDRILYDTDTGALYYDADGSGAGGKIQFAVIGASDAAVTAADFSVYNV